MVRVAAGDGVRRPRFVVVVARHRAGGPVAGTGRDGGDRHRRDPTAVVSPFTA
ncbi:MAG: hypothetical protein WKF80_07580 [Thermomicrobiales bacterium]